MHVLLLGDSLTFHGPDSAVPPSDPRLWPQVAAGLLGPATGEDVVIDLFAREGWTARDAWWALTRDPTCWGEALPRADVLVLATGGMDALPAAIPTYLRQGITYIRPGSLRRQVRRSYQQVAPAVMRLSGGRLRQLPQQATDHYHSRLVQAVRVWRPGLPVMLLGPAPTRSQYYPSVHGHGEAVGAARRWAHEHDAGFVDLDPLVGPAMRAGTANPDGLHWSWEVHAAVGAAVAQALAPLLDRPAR